MIQTASDQAQVAIDALCALPPDDKVIIAREALYGLGGFPQPNVTNDVAEYERWRLNEMKYVRLVREGVLTQLGRWLKTVPGAGFQLLNVLDSVRYARDAAFRQADSALARNAHIIGKTKPNGMVEQLEKDSASIAIGAARGALQQASKFEMRQAAHREAADEAITAPRAGNTKSVFPQTKAP